MNKQQITLDGVIIPYAIYKGEKYYPTKYVLSKFLLKSNAQLHKDDMYKPFIMKLEIDWSFKETAPQFGNCMNKDGWKVYLDNCKHNRNKTKEKADRCNIWCDYIGSNNKINNKEPKYDNYTLDCIDYIKSINTNVNIKKCTECNRELPQTSGFFVMNEKGKQGYYYKCKMCQGSVFAITYDHYYDKYSEYIYRNFGDDGYVLNKNNDVEFYNKYVHNNTNGFEMIIKDLDYRKELFYKIIKYYYKNGQLKDDNFTIQYLFDNIKIKYPISFIYINDIYEYCTDGDCTKRPWLYKNYKGYVNKDLNWCVETFKLYMNENNIDIDNITTFAYTELFRKSHIDKTLGKLKISYTEFLVKLYKYAYAGYKFGRVSENYYKNKDNVIFDMKWLIEKDLKLDINKIPLYITKTFLHEQYPSLYNILNKSYYSGNLFDLINECYPNKFIEQDFSINKYRIEFDSFEEAQVDRILRDNLENVIYNIRNSKNEVTIKGIKPDWIIINDKGIILCEYFGMYLKNGGQVFKERLEKYRIKTERKFKIYGELLKVGYRHLYIFPEDLKDNYKLLRLKIDKIK